VRFAPLITQYDNGLFVWKPSTTQSGGNGVFVPRPSGGRQAEPVFRDGTAKVGFCGKPSLCLIRPYGS
jgi:hypothetical protein